MARWRRRSGQSQTCHADLIRGASHSSVRRGRQAVVSRFRAATLHDVRLPDALLFLFNRGRERHLPAPTKDDVASTCRRSHDCARSAAVRLRRRIPDHITSARHRTGTRSPWLSGELAVLSHRQRQAARSRCLRNPGPMRLQRWPARAGVP